MGCDRGRACAEDEEGGLPGRGRDRVLERATVTGAGADTEMEGVGFCVVVSVFLLFLFGVGGYSCNGRNPFPSCLETVLCSMEEVGL